MAIIVTFSISEELFLCSFQDMLYLRTCSLVEYEDANRNLDKAKPHKRVAVSKPFIHI